MQAKGPGSSSGRSRRQKIVPCSWPSQSSQLGVPGSAWATVPADQAVDFHFRDLMADPFAALLALYAEMGLEFTAEAEAGMRAFLTAHPADEHGTHTYTFSATGLDEDEVRARMQRYETYFAVPREPLG